MPPRIPISDLTASLSSLRLGLSFANGSSIPASVTRRPTCLHNLHTTAIRPIATKKHNLHPMIVAKRKDELQARKNRAEYLKKEREAATVDPVLGKPTPFIEQVLSKPEPMKSIDSLLSVLTADDFKKRPFHDFIGAIGREEPKGPVNHFLTGDIVSLGISNSANLTKPYASDGRAYVDPMIQHQWEEANSNASVAINRILSLGNGSAGDQKRAMKQMCIDTFGRHNTKLTLPPAARKANVKRLGPDTGSSEVQISILTMKIQALAKHLEGTRKDMANKRNLRLLVHKRQKLLKYLKKRERGGPRYQNVLDAIGLDDHAVMEELFTERGSI